MLVEEVSAVVGLKEDGSIFGGAGLLKSPCVGNIGLPVAGRNLENGLEVSVDGGSL